MAAAKAKEEAEAEDRVLKEQARAKRLEEGGADGGDAAPDPADLHAVGAAAAAAEAADAAVAAEIPAVRRQPAPPPPPASTQLRDFLRSRGGGGIDLAEERRLGAVVRAQALASTLFLPPSTSSAPCLDCLFLCFAAAESVQTFACAALAAWPWAALHVFRAVRWQPVSICARMPVTIVHVPGLAGQPCRLSGNLFFSDPLGSSFTSRWPRPVADCVLWQELRRATEVLNALNINHKGRHRH